MDDKIAGPARIPVTGVLYRFRRIALAVIAVLVAVSTLVSFAESYRALFEWSVHHGVPYGWSLVWPAMIDVFIAVGELALFVALVDRWSLRERIFPWSVTLAGLAVSIAGNIGHVPGHVLTDRATASIPPLAAAVSLGVGMAVLKRVVQHRQGATEAVATESPQMVADSPVPDDSQTVVPGPQASAQDASEVPQAHTSTTFAHTEDQAVAGTVTDDVPTQVTRTRTKTVGRKRVPRTVAERAHDRYAELILSGSPVPSLRTLMSELNVGQPKAREARSHLCSLSTANGHAAGGEQA